MPRMQILDYVGLVSIVERENGILQLRWKKSAKPRDFAVRSLGAGTDYEVAIAEAKRLDEELKRAAQIERESLIGRQTLDSALKHGLKNAKGQSPRHQSNQEQCGKRFLTWLQSNFPHVTYADQLKPSIVVRYIDDQLERKLATSTIKQVLNVIRLAYNRLHLVDPDTYPLMVIKHPRLTNKRHTPTYLERTELEELLQHATPNAIPAILLCGFAGLRLTEAAALTFGDLDPDAGTLHTGAKTQYSVRTIPIAEWVMERLMDSAGGTVATLPAADTPLCSRSEYNPSVPEEYIAKAIRRSLANCEKRRERKHAKILQEWEAGAKTTKKPELLHFPEIVPRNLRTSFACMAVQASVPAEELKRYMGHRPDSVLAMHYADYSRIDMLRQRVVDTIENHFKQPAAAVKDITTVDNTWDKQWDISESAT